MAPKVLGQPKFHRRVSDMKKGEIGYVTGWSYNPIDNVLDMDAYVSLSPHGTADLQIHRTFITGEFEVDLRTTSHEY